MNRRHPNRLRAVVPKSGPESDGASVQARLGGDSSVPSSSSSSDEEGEEPQVAQKQVQEARGGAATQTHVLSRRGRGRATRASPQEDEERTSMLQGEQQHRTYDSELSFFTEACVILYSLAISTIIPSLACGFATYAWDQTQTFTFTTPRLLEGNDDTCPGKPRNEIVFVFLSIVFGGEVGFAYLGYLGMIIVLVATRTAVILRDRGVALTTANARSWKSTLNTVRKLNICLSFFPLVGMVVPGIRDARGCVVENGL